MKKSEFSDENRHQDLNDSVVLLQLYVRLFGVNTDIHQLVHQFGNAEQNFSSAQMLMALRGLGFEADYVKGRISKLDQVPVPFLLPINQGGFAIVGKIDKERVLMQRAGHAQPEQLDRPSFDALFEGAWISAKLKPNSNVTNDQGAVQFGLGWFWNSLKKYRSLMGEVLLASLFVQLFALLSPMIFQVVIDKVLTHRSMTTLDVMAIALLGVSIFEVVLSTMRHYLLSHTSNRIDVELGSQLFRHLLHLPLSYFETRRSGDTVARMRELENARNFLTGTALTSWLDLLFALVFIAVMFYYSPTLTFIVLAALPVFFLASLVITPLLRSKLEDKFAMGAENQAFLVETVTAMETVKSQAVEPQWQREFEQRLANYVNAAFEGGHIGNLTNQFVSLASKVLTVLLLWFGAKSVIDGDLTVGALIAFNMLSGRVNAPVIKLASLWQEVTQMKVSMKRLAEILDAQTEPMFSAERSTPQTLKGAVSFDRVTFRYRPDGPEVLSDISLNIKPGEVVGFVGASGAGKTTLMRLVQRMYTPERGRILIDGMDLSLIDTSWLRRHMGVVSQDSVLFNRSVRDNIAVSNSALNMDDVIEAAKLAGAHDFILSMPEGYDTLIGERGARLSGGQRARIAIARALVTKPKILLFDEATAALDYESERIVFDNMKEICKGRTVFVIAHRLSTLRMTDKLFVLDQGRLVQEGSHIQLIAQKGRYQSLYQANQAIEASSQAASFAR